MTRRYLTAASRERLVVSRVVSFLGLGILAILGIMWSQDPQATIFQVAPFGLVGLALVAGSQLLARKQRQCLRVDLSTRQATFVAKGTDRWSASLDELGPVVCVPFERRRYRKGVAYDLTEYQAALSGQKHLALQGSSDYPPSRRFALRLAREWGVGFRGLDGRVRDARSLDAPLKPGQDRIAPLDPESGVITEAKDGVTILRSTALPRGSAFPDLYILGGAALGLAGLRERHADQVFLDPAFQPLETALLAALALAVLGAASVFLLQVRAFLLPAALAVDESRVRYRGRSLRVGDVREVVSTNEILILTNRDYLAIPADFCRPGATPAVVRTIHRLIADRAAGAPMGL